MSNMLSPKSFGANVFQMKQMKYIGTHKPHRIPRFEAGSQLLTTNTGRSLGTRHISMGG